MKMKIYIDVNENEIRRDPDWLATFLKGYLSQLAGYKVTDVDLLDDDENKIDNQKIIQNKPVTNNKYKNKLNDVKNEQIKNSLIELTKVFKEK